LLGTGASNKEISGQLNISDNTVKSHLKAIFVALGVSRRTASIQKARALGLI
jgi:ATP/maltotriose-dependent transcriptional regulator MalT